MCSCLDFDDSELVVSHSGFEGLISVMPAKLVPDSDLGAGIQVHSARAAGWASWIPGLALLARNDAALPLTFNVTDYEIYTTNCLTFM